MEHREPLLRLPSGCHLSLHRLLARLVSPLLCCGALLLDSVFPVFPPACSKQKSQACHTCLVVRRGFGSACRCRRPESFLIYFVAENPSLDALKAIIMSGGWLWQFNWLFSPNESFSQPCMHISICWFGITCLVCLLHSALAFVSSSVSKLKYKLITLLSFSLSGSRADFAFPVCCL